MIVSKDSFENPKTLKSDPRVLFFTKTSIDKETPNEDALGVFCPCPGAYIFAVADGAGGHPKGEDAAKKCLEEISRALNGVGEKNSFRVEILNGIEQANSQLLESGIGCKTTVTIVEHFGDFARSYQVGDSSALICGQRGKLKFRTTSHSPVGYSLEAGTIDEVEAMLHPDLNIVSNLLGDSEMKIEIGPEIEINKNDTIFLASDGLFDNFSTESIVEIVRKGSIEDISQELIKNINSQIYQNPKAKQDDLSFILFQPN